MKASISSPIAAVLLVAAPPMEAAAVTATKIGVSLAGLLRQPMGDAAYDGFPLGLASVLLSIAAAPTTLVFLPSL